MNKLINAIAGENAKPARKYAAIAALATAAALIVAVVVLAVSSVVFAIADRGAEELPSGEGGGDGVNVGGGVSSSIEYKTVTKDELDGELEKAEAFKERDERKIASKSENDLYYAKNGEVKLTKSAMTAAHNMFVDFCKNTPDLITDVGPKADSTTCNIPLVVDGKNGVTFSVQVFGNNKSIAGNTTYKWIFDNAFSYGFIYSDNTFTYVGVAAATYMKNGITLNKLAENLASKSVSVSAKAAGAAKATSYQLYYISADAQEFKLPTNYNYTVTANGDNGYIIAVDMTKKPTAAQ